MIAKSKNAIMSGLRAVPNDANPQNLSHIEQDHKKLAHAVFFQALKDLKSSNVNLWGPAWDFLSGKTVEDRNMRKFWSSVARIDPQIVEDWAIRHELELLKKAR